MAESLPHPDKLRVILTDRKFTAEDLARYAEQFLAAGRPNVAAMLLERAKPAGCVARLKQIAVETGDEFLLSAVARADAASVSAEEWRACAQQALAQGKLAFARDAFRKAGDADAAAQAHAKYLGLFSSPPQAEGPARR